MTKLTNTELTALTVFTKHKLASDEVLSIEIGKAIGEEVNTGKYPIETYLDLWGSRLREVFYPIYSELVLPKITVVGYPPTKGFNSTRPPLQDLPEGRVYLHEEHDINC